MSDLWSKIKPVIAAGHRLQVTVRKEKRSKDQNALMWTLLEKVANQVEWYGEHLTADDWKNMLTASMKQQKTVPGINGGFVVLGASTSKMTKQELSDLVELIYAFGAEKGVSFAEQAEQQRA